MTEFLVLRFDAPLMSFGATRVDQLGITQDHPTLSQLAGILGNALGYRHSDTEQLQDLQSRVQYGVRRDREGRVTTDYQTVDLGQSFLAETGWTTHGRVQSRAGAFSEGTHIRYRDYWADAVFTIVLTLDPPAPSPTVEDLAAALREPARPLFLGRKPCLPSGPLLVGQLAADSIVAALARAPFAPHVQPVNPAWAWRPEGTDALPGETRVITDERDWANQIHVGERLVRAGWIPIEAQHE